jgi:hypothetical protein
VGKGGNISIVVGHSVGDPYPDPDLFAGSGSGNFSPDPDPDPGSGSDPLKVLIINHKR